MSNIKNYYYPIKSYQQFEKHVLTRKVVLDNFPQVKMGNHYRMLVVQYEVGKLEEELGVLKKLGILSYNQIPSQTIIR